MSLTIEALEYYLPDNVETNQDLLIENPDWNLDKVLLKTGVFQRHIANKNQTAFDLSVKACEKLFTYNEIKEIDGIIFCTQSPDYIMPSNSFLLHDYFNFKKEVFAYDFNHACSGFVYSLWMANSLIKSGVAKEILLVNADTYSKYINKKDRSTRVLFGDAAAATIVKKSKNNSGIVDISLASSGVGYNQFWIPAGGLRKPKSELTSIEKKDNNGNIRTENDIIMDGLGVWSFINSVVPKQINDLIKRNNLNKDDIDQYIFHQASKMTLDSLIRRLNISEKKAFINLQNIGNTVSASIPIALKDSLIQNRIKEGDMIIISGFGVGLSYGALLMEY